MHQKFYSLALVCNIASGCAGTRAELQQKMDDALQPSIDNLGFGGWNVVWGPTVWRLHPDDTTSAADHIWASPNRETTGEKSQMLLKSSLSMHFARTRLRRRESIRSMERKYLEQAIRTVYGKLLAPLHLLVSKAIELMIAKHVRLLHVDYVPIQGMMLTPDDAPPTPKRLLCFISTALTQHTTAYTDFFGAPAPPPLCKASGLAEAPIISVFNDARMTVEEGEEGTRTELRGVGMLEASLWRPPDLPF
ncbi:hypothetical protein BDN71DRAFT_1430575 [Pleurotus eryngii]|uniref:Uncharacterized protein n=1 Tax=Pleurotus eryngii TaxID=5323 RepID=A0A9P6A0Z6_PLEER|nr:hypothetical protein BDN71DRAFT_1430575 [Pleurotus eryngii]